jgi:hypothetical protein
VLNRLLDEHARIRDVADQIVTIIAGARAEDAMAFWRLRWTMLALILENLRHEKAMVTEPLLRDPRPEVVAVAKSFEAELADITNEYLNHIIRWNSDEGLTDWTIYGEQVGQLIGILRDRMEREERLLYPLVWPDMAER